MKKNEEKEDVEREGTLSYMLHKWYSMTVSDLKDEARRNGLKVSGTKQDLIFRLEEHHKQTMTILLTIF